MDKRFASLPGALVLLLGALLPVTTSGADEAKVASSILSRVTLAGGICSVPACGDGALAIEIATQSKLLVHATDPDPGNVAAARTRAEEAGLLGTRLGGFPEQLGEARARFLGTHGLIAGRRPRRRLAPFGESRPGAQPGGPVPRIRIASGQRDEDGRSPQPAAAIHRLRDRARLGVSLSAELLKQKTRRGREAHAFFGRPARQIDPERLGKPARRRYAEPRRSHECEQLQQVIRGERSDAEPGGGCPHVANKGDHARLLQQPCRLAMVKPPRITIRRLPGDSTQAGNDCRPFRQPQPGGGSRGTDHARDYSGSCAGRSV